MRRYFYAVTVFPVIFFCLSASSQNIAINSTGNSPNESAMLDVQSTTKGMLIPRMTTAQRTAIASPATGLLVFDITTNSFWFRNAAKWIELIDNSNNTWTAKGSDVYVNNGENVGIGTNNPETRLQISNGTDLSATSGGYLQLGAGSLSNLAFDNNEIQARNNKVASSLYIQHSGGDLQIGSLESGTSNVHINNGKLQKPATGAFNMMPLCYGNVNANGSVASATPNVIITRLGKGQYSIKCSDITASTIIVGSLKNYAYNQTISLTYDTIPTPHVLVTVYSAALDDYHDNGFSFICYNP